MLSPGPPGDLKIQGVSKSQVLGLAWIQSNPASASVTLDT